MAQTTWFRMPDVFSAKGEWVKHGVKGHEVRDSKNVQVRYGSGEGPMGHLKLLLSKGVSLIRGEVGSVGAGLGGVWRLEALRQKSRPEISASVGMFDSWWEGRRLYF